MKKFISIIAAGVMASAMMSSISAAYADVDPLTYCPSFRFGSADESFTVGSDGVLEFDRALLKNGNYTLKLAVYIHDDSLKVWDIRSKWVCYDEHIHLTDLVDPKHPLIPYAYAEADSAGNLINNDYETMIYSNPDKNTMAMTCTYSSSNDSTPLKPYGEATDSYPLTYFSAVIDKDTPAGDYTIEFRTEPKSEYPDIINVNLRTENGPRVVYPDSSNLQNLTISIKDKPGTTLPDDDFYELGDVDQNGTIDASDATLTLQTYSEYSTNQPVSISSAQLKAADTNQDGKIDSSDGTNILSYYSFLSTGGNSTFTEFMKTMK